MAVLAFGITPINYRGPIYTESCRALTIQYIFSSTDDNTTQDIGSDEVLRRLAMFRDVVRKRSDGNKVRAAHTWWPLRSKPANQFAKFPSSVLLCDQLGVSETDFQQALGCSSVTEKRITQYDAGFSVRKFYNLDFVTVLELGSVMLEHDVVASRETIAQQDCAEVKMLVKLDSSANMQKRRRQEDGTTDDSTGKKSKEQDRKEIMKEHLKTMTLDQTATFVDRVFTTIESLCGMIDKSRSAMVRSSIEPIVMNFNSDNVSIDLTTILDYETPGKKHSRGHYRGIQKALDVYATATKIAMELAKIASDMGPTAYGEMHARISRSFTEKSESYLQKRSDDRIEELVRNMNVQKAPNAREQKTGYDVAPRLLGLVPFSEVRKDRHNRCLELELIARGIPFAATENFTNILKKLRQAETNRLTTEHPSIDSKDHDKKHFKTISPQAVFEYLEFEEDAEGIND